MASHHHPSLSATPDSSTPTSHHHADMNGNTLTTSPWATSHPCTEPTHHLPSSNQDIISELKTLTSNQSELITELKIRIAVLENEVQHAKQEKDAVEKSLGIVIQSLTRASLSPPAYPCDSHSNAITLTSNPQASRERLLESTPAVQNPANGSEGDVKDLEQEIERLRKENRGLRRRARERDLVLLGHVSEREDEIHSRKEQHVRFSHRTSSPSFLTSKQKGKGKDHQPTSDSDKKVLNSASPDGDISPSQLLGSWGHDTPRSSLGLGIHSSSSPRQHRNGTSTFASGSSTVPNTPVLNSRPFGRGFEDIGMHSLEEELARSDSHQAPTISSSQTRSRQQTNPSTLNPTSSSSGNKVKDEETQQLEQQRRVMESFSIAPKPGILKVGFGEDCEGEMGRRGLDYGMGEVGVENPYCGRAREVGGSYRVGEYGRFASGNQAQPSLPKDASQLSSFFEQYLSSDKSENVAQGFQESGGDSVWICPEEREDAIRVHQRTMGSGTSKSFVDFFRYGIAYLPSETDNNLFRTVCISNIPSSIPLHGVLSRVRGGEIVSASLLDTGTITGGQTALVQFVHESAASEYISYITNHPVVFGPNKAQAQISLVPTPTWPINIPSRRRIHEHRQTRVLYILDFPTQISLDDMVSQLGHRNAFQAATLLRVEYDETGTLWLEFSSSNAAGSAFGILTNRAAYSALVIGFASDSCARPLEDLLSSPALKLSEVSRIVENGGKVDLKVKCRNCAEEFETNTRLYAHLREVHRVGGFKGFEDAGAALLERQRKVFENGDVVGQVTDIQRKRLTALANQKVDVPSFSGRAIEGSSWADEVIEADTPPSSSTMPVPPNSPIASQAEHGINGITVDNVNDLMAQCWTYAALKAPAGLKGSKYASLVPSFSDTGSRPRLLNRAISTPLAVSHLPPLSKSEDGDGGGSNSANEQPLKSENEGSGANTNSGIEQQPQHRLLTPLEINRSLSRLSVFAGHAPFPDSLTSLIENCPLAKPIKDLGLNNKLCFNTDPSHASLLNFHTSSSSGSGEGSGAGSGEGEGEDEGGIEENTSTTSSSCSEGEEKRYGLDCVKRAQKSVRVLSVPDRGVAWKGSAEEKKSVKGAVANPDEIRLDDD